jgi:hypothetical protein
MRMRPPDDEPLLHRTWLSLVPAALLLHAVEEGVATPRLLAQMAEINARLTGRVFDPPSAEQTSLLLVLLVGSAFGLGLLARRWHTALYGLVLLQGVMALNVLSHTAGALMLGEYSPGLVTAWVLEAPLSVVIFQRLRSEPWMTRVKWGALVPLVLLMHGPVLRAALTLSF